MLQVQSFPHSGPSKRSDDNRDSAFGTYFSEAQEADNHCAALTLLDTAENQILTRDVLRPA